MDRRPIPDDQELAWKLAQEQAQEAHHIVGTVGMILALHHEPSLGGDPSDRGEMIMGQLDAQHGSMPTRRIGADRHREQAKARFIYEDDGAFFLDGLFLSAGQRSCFHLPIAASSRWVACWMGF